MTVEKSGEFRGKTVEAAISAGLAALRLSLDEVTVEIVRRQPRRLGHRSRGSVVRLTTAQPGKPEPTPARQSLEPQAEPEPAIPSTARSPGLWPRPERPSRLAKLACPTVNEHGPGGRAEGA